jgi:hypothetical protein
MTVTLGLLCTAAGGYVTARMARSAVWKHVFAMSLLSFFTGIASLFYNSASGTALAWWQFPIALLAFPAAFAGGWFRVATRDGKA